MTAEQDVRLGVLNSLLTTPHRELARAVQQAREQQGLSPEQVLRKDVVVPLAAKKNLRSVLGFQIGKQTPFAPEEIYFDYRIAAEDRAEKKLRVTLSLVPRADVDELTKELGKISMPVAGFVATTGKRKVIGRLDFSRKKAEGKGRSITPEAVLCVTAAILLLATAVIPIVEQQRQLNRLLTEVAAARSVARVTSDLRDEMSALMEARDYAAVQKMTAIPVTQAVRDLTRGIPDDTWLTQLNSNGDEIRIAGFTPSAPELVATLEQDPAFRDAALVSKVTRDEEIDLDSFQMRLSIRRLSDQ